MEEYPILRNTKDEALREVALSVSLLGKNKGIEFF